MIPGGGFTDLRLNRPGRDNEEGFWPSFADIMTVVVMIFLLAMVILLLRNQQLVEELRATLAAEREATALAKARGAEKETLAQRLRLANSELELLHRQVARLETASEQQEIAISSQTRRIEALRAEKARLGLEAQRAREQAGTLNDRLQAESHRRQGLEAEQARQARRLQEARKRLEALRQAHQAQGQALAASRAEAAAKAGRLQQAQRHEADLEARLARAEALARDLSARLEAQAGEIQARGRALDEAKAHAKALDDQVAALRLDLARARDRADDLQGRLKAASSRAAETEAALREARARIAGLQETARAQQAALAAAEGKRRDLRAEYDRLQLSYDALVRPARSAEGRYLVEVRYRKVAGRERIELRAGPDRAFVAVDRKTLEGRLEALKRAHPEGLYVRVIIPRDSGLSFNEGWRFTNHLHRLYDYYFQGKAPNRGPASPDSHGESHGDSAPAARDPELRQG